MSGHGPSGILHGPCCVRMARRDPGVITVLRNVGIRHRHGGGWTADGSGGSGRGNYFLLDGDAGGGTHRSATEASWMTLWVLMRVRTGQMRVASAAVWRINPAAGRRMRSGSVGTVEGWIRTGMRTSRSASYGRGRGVVGSTGEGRCSVDGISDGIARRGIGRAWRTVGLGEWAWISHGRWRKWRKGSALRRAGLSLGSLCG